MIPQRKTEAEKARIVAQCGRCGGAGCAHCQKYCSFIDRMAEACIPVDYWFREMDQWYGDPEFAERFGKSYLSRIGAAYAEGKVLCLLGHRGVGKTMAACAALKGAILSGYSAHYTSLVDAVDFLLSGDAHEYRRLLRSADFLVVDEVDQRFFDNPNSRQLYGNQFEYILRTRTQNRLPMIMCSNSERIEDIFFNAQAQESFVSLGAQFLTVVPVEGGDARRKEGEQ